MPEYNRMSPKKQTADREANVKVGNYRSNVDTSGISDEFSSLFGTKASKGEADYLKSRGGAPAAREAVRRARKANRKPPLAEEE